MGVILFFGRVRIQDLRLLRLDRVYIGLMGFK